MGLSALDCPRCGRWDDDGEYPTLHGSRAIALRGKLAKVEGRTKWTDICDKCFAELESKGGKVFYLKEVTRYVRVYKRDPHVDYGSIKHVQCRDCYQYYDPKLFPECPFKKWNAETHQKLEAKHHQKVEAQV